MKIKSTDLSGEWCYFIKDGLTKFCFERTISFQDGIFSCCFFYQQIPQNSNQPPVPPDCPQATSPQPRPFKIIAFLEFDHWVSLTYLPTMLNLPLAMMAANKMLKETFISSKLSLRSTTMSATETSDNPVMVVLARCKSTST